MTEAFASGDAARSFEGSRATVGGGHGRFRGCRGSSLGGADARGDDGVDGTHTSVTS